MDTIQIFKDFVFFNFVLYESLLKHFYYILSTVYISMVLKVLTPQYPPKSNFLQSGNPFSTKFNKKVDGYQVKVNLVGSKSKFLENEDLSSDFVFTSQHCWIPPTYSLSSPWGYWGTILRTPDLYSILCAVCQYVLVQKTDCRKFVIIHIVANIYALRC